MKIAIASDLHGSWYYTQKLLTWLDATAPEKTLLLGELLYHGPRHDLPTDYQPKRVIEALNQRAASWVCVRGNCDTEVDQMVLQFPILADCTWLMTEQVTLLATHGHRNASLPPLQAGQVLLQGHTHVPMFEKKEGWLHVNPGSVSIPKEGSPHSAMLLEGRELSWIDLETQTVYRRERI